MLRPCGHCSGCCSGSALSAVCGLLAMVGARERERERERERVCVSFAAEGLVLSMAPFALCSRHTGRQTHTHLHTHIHTHTHAHTHANTHIHTGGK